MLDKWLYRLIAYLMLVYQHYIKIKILWSISSAMLFPPLWWKYKVAFESVRWIFKCKFTFILLILVCSNLTQLKIFCDIDVANLAFRNKEKYDVQSIARCIKKWAFKMRFRQRYYCSWVLIPLNFTHF